MSDKRDKPSELDDPYWVKYWGKHTLPEVLRAMADVIEKEQEARYAAA